MKSVSALLIASSVLAGTVVADSSLSGKIEFSGVGFDMPYNPISKIDDSKNTCKCELSKDQKWYSGINAPFSEPLAVHINGPTQLKKFAYYTSDHFVVGKNTSAGWKRGAYFDNTESSPVMENVTFLSHVGKDSNCFGKALTFFSQDVQKQEKVNTPPGKYLDVGSGVEYMIYSNITCPKSSINGGCGVYRSDAAAFYGFDGVTKMFLFEFTMPTDSMQGASNTPVIWLSGDSLARVTDKYGLQTNCSCLFQGCGELNVFSANATHMNSSMITLQGANVSGNYSELFTGNIASGKFLRPVNTTVTGGVILDSEGNVITFISDSSSFDSELTANAVNSMLDALPQLGNTDQLKAGNLTAPSSTTSKNAGSIMASTGGVWLYLFALLAATAHSVVGF
ncbi:hypothetical protein DAKH74_040080 [Maudiozyma humilis]|uniref:glucan endo-1,3-beta-D-glucosidase n=1 Tax=Maudiozyma humilis TaxID=51915 RepID=A0AAV5S1B4_MAUHU|nr:hypothetical protein DAKH74_040080 [Kazachstania humilis]